MPILRAGLIGEHISRTRLPAALEILCVHAGWTLNFELIDTAHIPEFDFTARMDQARTEGWTGMTVTHPWKRDARAYAGDQMTAQVAHLGASNTVIFEPELAGYNTDYTGFLAAFSEFGHPPGRVVMVGAGGVAEAIAPALIALGATDLTICDINGLRAEAIAKATGARAIEPSQVAEFISKADGLINATPIGMAEYPGTAFSGPALGSQKWAFDAVYTPTRTLFLKEAEAADLACLSGFELFKAMAVRSFEAYTGVLVDDPTVRAELDRLNPG